MGLEQLPAEKDVMIKFDRVCFADSPSTQVTWKYFSILRDWKKG
jgi:hypothetical protein